MVQVSLHDSSYRIASIDASYNHVLTPTGHAAFIVGVGGRLSDRHRPAFQFGWYCGLSARSASCCSCCITVKVGGTSGGRRQCNGIASRGLCKRS